MTVPLRNDELTTTIAEMVAADLARLRRDVGREHEGRELVAPGVEAQEGQPVFVGADGGELAAERCVHQPQQEGQQRRHAQQHQRAVDQPEEARHGPQSQH